ncbi:MAG: coiled coil domain-containing protein [Deltaproteobacteria bacterium]|nr:coiled coil domain-containing protein [Deltaproteobacteria bacterium]
MSLKKAYEQKFEAQLKEWNAEIEKLKTKAGKAKAEAHIAYHENIEKIKEKKEVVQKKLADLRAAGEDAWEDLRAGVEKAWKNFEEAVKSAMNQFK